MILFVAVGVGIAFGVRELVQRSEQPTVTVYDFPNSVYSKVNFGNFTANRELRTREGMTPLFTSHCTEAFASAGLRSPLEVATHEGVVILPSKDLYMYSADRLGLAGDEIRLSYLKEFSEGRAQALTIPSTLYGVQLTTDGRTRVFLHDTAFWGKSFIFGRLSLNDVLTHEFIHVGGQPPTPGWFFQHDLAGFEHYDEIMEACR